MEAKCSCGQVTVELVGPPSARLFCHCLNCQKANQAPFADVTFQRAKHVRSQEGDVAWRRMQYFPVSVKRGYCTRCDDLIVEELFGGPLAFVFVPSSRFGDADRLPPALGHIFYHRRVNDIADDLPKLEGFVKSQLTVTRWMLPLLAG